MNLSQTGQKFLQEFYWKDATISQERNQQMWEEFNLFILPKTVKNIWFLAATGERSCDLMRHLPLSLKCYSNALQQIYSQPLKIAGVFCLF